MIAEGAFGRPEDKDIEREFMRKIRGDKLQAINAECELEICLAFKNEHKKEKSRNKKSKKKETEDDTQALENKMMSVPIGTLQPERREELYKMFKELKANWTFEEIAEDQPLPDYFFEDGCDLSYILYELQKTENPLFQEFSVQDLIFLELLCLEGRKLLNEKIIQYYEQNMQFMILAMENGLQKIKERLKTHKGGQRFKDRKVSNQNGQGQIPISEDMGPETENQKSTQKVNEKKTKKIKKKNQKNVSKKGSKNKNNQSEYQNQDQHGQEQQNTYPKEEQLALKTCNYISWAYWYIIKKE